MWCKLAVKNFGKSFHDYAIYFFTLVIGVAIFYMFNSVYAQQEIMSVTESAGKAMESLRGMLSYISVFVAGVLGFLIVYANSFFMKRRKKEIGVYLILGVPKSVVSLMLLLEILFLAVAALIVGLAAGFFGSQVMSVFTAKIFEADLTRFTFVFSLEAVEKSVLYFGIIFAVVAVCDLFLLERCQLIELLHGGRKNENSMIRPAAAKKLFPLSIVLLVAAYLLILQNGILDVNLLFTLSLILGAAGTVIFFLSGSGLLVRWLQKHRNLYFKNLNLFVMQQLNSKMNTNFMSVSIVCIVLFLAIGIFSCGYGIQDVMSDKLRNVGIFDFSITRYEHVADTSIWEDFPEEIHGFDGMERWWEFPVYGTGEGFEADSRVLFGSDEDLFAYGEKAFVALSDYNMLCSMKNMEEAVLPQGQYMVVLNSSASASSSNSYQLAKAICDNGLSVSVSQTRLTAKGQFVSVPIAPGTGSVLLVVPDELLLRVPIRYRTLDILCTGRQESEKLQDMLDSYYAGQSGSSHNDYVDSYLDAHNQAISTKAMVAFLAVYLGIVFMIACAVILAIQQLSEAEDNRERYALLKKLGTDEKMIHQALFCQVLCYFLAPLLLAFVHAVAGIGAAREAIFLFGDISVVLSVFVTMGVVLGVYGFYFLLTYMGSRKIVDKCI